ncbi:hypothetical protein EG328_000211 [Venturia inaequalis]|uniref:C2H2-type domain-containing protein n=1 Tax=Venturia inaequalis TaxID=5025 RepID=A0A8H3U3G3_VENIN|nr:hypothetical protein EG328_000211 [Venturia inaequalis]KAE9977645.1 hypothetical protein EG327_007661 [Venturia inaequalis]RDI85578.1 hypothetical protein Vi05172_g4419 [Venturia inaequalis]
MTRAQPSQPDTPIEHRKTNDVDSHLEEFLAPAALLELTRGAGREHKALRDTCTPACTTSPDPIQDCLGCRNGTFGNDCDFHCDSCLVECASSCNNEDCDIPQACYVEHCPTECQDKDCDFEPCPVSTCGPAPATCTKSCFDESCFSIADTSLGFDPQLCEQGECHTFSSCDSGIWTDFSQSHHFSNHFPSSMFTNNTSVWDHSIPQFHGHHSHDHQSNSNTNHKRRRLDGGSSQSSLHSHNCYEPSYAWPALDVNFGFGCGNSSFNFQPQQSARPSAHLGNGCQSNQFGQTFTSSANYGSDLQTQNQLSFTTDFTSPTSNSYLTSPTNFSDAGSNTFFSANGTNPSEQAPSVLTDHEQQLEGLMCKWKHAAGLSDIEFASVMEHSPYCPDVSSKLTRQRSPPADQLPFTEPETSTAASTGKRSNRQSMEVSTTCQWVTSDPHSNLPPHTCDQTFANSKELDEHVQKEHTNRLGAQQFVCGWKGCNTSFKHRGKLNRHISGAHSRYHAYRCSHCDRTFCTKEQLKNHETTHTGEKKYKCQYCDHRSATKTQHNTHERTHTKLKPYACPYCDHRSGDSSNLSKHVKNKHPETRNLPTGQTRRSKVKSEKAV